MIDFEKELNPMQYQAVADIDGTQLIIAGAGTGKTRTIVYRVAYLVSKGINPESVLLITFTRKAAHEMVSRAAALLDGRCSKISGGTFHSTALMMLRKYAEAIGYTPAFTIIDRGETEDLVDLLRERFIKNSKTRFPRKDEIVNILSKSVNNRRSLEDILSDEYPKYLNDLTKIQEISAEFTAYKKAKNIMDYDDLLVNCRDLLKNNSGIRKKISMNYRYVLVDEYQDTNRIQAHMAFLAASEHGNLTVVGDDAQSIYSFRGADYKNIIEFPGIVDGTKIHRLEINYRSVEPILAFTNAITLTFSEGYDKKLVSDLKGDIKPFLADSLNKEEQARFICERVLELREQGVPLGDIAVLFRGSSDSRELEFELAARNIPFIKFGGLRFLELAHVKDILAILRISRNEKDEPAWFRALNLIEGVGRATSREITAEIFEHGTGALLAEKHSSKKYAKQLSMLHDVIDVCRSEIIPVEEKINRAYGFYYPLFKNRYEDFASRDEDLKAIINLSKRYADIDTFMSDLSVDAFRIGEVRLVDDMENEKLVLSTIHSAKGLEWHTVFVINLLHGIVPSSRCSSPEEIEEERRVFYVACSRAKRLLYLCAPTDNGLFPQSGFITDTIKKGGELERLDLASKYNYEQQYTESRAADESSEKKVEIYNQIKNYFD
jgi:DNA helicase-2/ATP-dependent DNA helicase PcrA